MQYFQVQVEFKKVDHMQDFLGGPVAKTPHSQCREPRFNPSQGRARMPQLKVPHAAVKMKTLCAETKPWHSQIHKQNKNIFLQLPCYSHMGTVHTY